MSFSIKSATMKTNQKKICSVCRDAGKTEKEYTSHFVRDKPGPDGKVVCPLLLSLNCRRCGNKGHTFKYCKVNTEKKTTKPEPVQEQPKPVQKKVGYAVLEESSDEEGDIKTPRSSYTPVQEKKEICRPSYADMLKPALKAPLAQLKAPLAQLKAPLAQLKAPLAQLKAPLAPTIRDEDVLRLHQDMVVLRPAPALQAPALRLRQAPALQKTQPLTQQMTLAQIMSLVQETQPLAQETQPLAQETQPLAQETQPLAQETQKKLPRAPALPVSKEETERITKLREECKKIVAQKCSWADSDSDEDD